MKNSMRFPFLATSFVFILFTACNLTRDVEIDLPEYDRQPVVECYLEPGKPFRLVLSRSYSFFDEFGLDSSFLQKTLLPGATVTIAYDGRVDTLYEQFSFDVAPFKFFNYTGKNIVPATEGMEFSLHISLPDGGGDISGQCTMLKKIPIDSISVEFGPEPDDTLARMITYVKDPKNEENYYRRLLNYVSLDSLPEQDFLSSDRFTESELIAFGTPYELAEGDTVFNSFYHLSKAHYDYTESVQLAVFGNINPFAQPSPIKSNVSGSGNPIGIFAPLVYDQVRTIVKR